MSSHGNALHAHQFDSIEQQRETELLGMWAFLVTEVMFFGGLFAVYAVYRFMYPGAYHELSENMSVVLGTINTGVLLFSSFTMVLAVHYCRAGRMRATIVSLLVTILCAFGFLGIKAVEYTAKYEHGMMIGKFFHPHHSADPQKLHLVTSLYFFMTGLHGVHVLIGIGVLLWLVWRAKRGTISSEKYMAVELTGLYWHFVDLVWVFLFPLFYLVHVR